MIANRVGTDISRREIFRQKGCEPNMAQLYDGIILKGIGGFYYIDTKKGVVECKARGIFRKEGVSPLVGDKVNVLIENDTDLTGTIEEIKPRKNALVRPPVANVTQIAIVIATAHPRPNTLILDKLIAEAEHQQIKILLCLNKTDLNQGEELKSIYETAGFDLLDLSALKKKNIDELKERLKDNTTVFAGNSGVGKSSLLNCVLGENSFETGSVSNKAERGKHTTRHSELVKLSSGGFIIDTPGFSSFELQFTQTEELCSAFREFRAYTENCRFHDCSHTVEKGCAVLEALQSGNIPLSRHQSYVQLYEKLKQLKPWENK